jgi:hypothetical protein
VTAPPRCWFCSGEIRSTERTKAVADLNVLVHVGCFDRLFESEGPRSWSAERRTAERQGPKDEKAS